VCGLELKLGLHIIKLDYYFKIVSSDDQSDLSIEFDV